jgi:hypothetical protein
MSFPRRLPLGLCLLALVALVLAGCGASSGSSGSSAQGPDPATLVPADAAAYGEAVVHPEGETASGVLAAVRKVSLVQDPGAALVRLIDKAGRRNDRHESYVKDIEPWLGSRIGGFLTIPPGGNGNPDACLIAASRDRSALQAEIARQRSDRSTRAGGSYRGVAYDVERSGSAPVAAVGDFLVLCSSRRAFDAAVDASKGAPSLAGSKRYTDAVGSLDANRLAFLYGDPHEIATQVRAIDGVSAKVKDFLDAPRFADAAPITLALTARADQIALELAGGTSLLGSAAAASGSEVSVGGLPGDAWLAAATPPLGPLIREALDSAGVHAQATAQVRGALGLDLDRDLLDPLGSLALFARGNGVLDLGGGALLQLRDAHAAQQLLTRIETIAGAASGGPVHSVAGGFELQVPQSPQPIVVLAKGDKIAAGYAASSAHDLLDPQQRFDDSTAGKAALASLGDGYTPSLVLIVPPIARLLSSLDQLDVANLSPVLPYLRAYRSLAAGAKRDGDRTVVRIVAALR